MHDKTPSSFFIWRRIHSLFGLWLVIYLIEHMLVNSQASLWIEDGENKFVRLVNSLENLPYLHVIETFLIGVPLLFHMGWGIKRIFSSKQSILPSSKAPYLKFERNFAYTIQRWSSWILLIGLIIHVGQMRFIDQPKKIDSKSEVILTMDPKLEKMAEKFQVSLEPLEGSTKLKAYAPDQGTAFLFMVREIFKSTAISIFYSIFVMAAAFHAFNGLWTFLLTWGILLSRKSQITMIPVCLSGSFIILFFGYVAIWGAK
jgi:succinate dehydrogenase / fumarate reductase cytochrome b subunit